MNFIRQLKAMPPFAITLMILASGGAAIWMGEMLVVEGRITATSGIRQETLICDLDISLADGENEYISAGECMGNFITGDYFLSSVSEINSTDPGCAITAEDLQIAVMNPEWLPWTTLNGENIPFTVASGDLYGLQIKATTNEARCPFSASLRIEMSPLA